MTLLGCLLGCKSRPAALWKCMKCVDSPWKVWDLWLTTYIRLYLQNNHDIAKKPRHAMVVMGEMTA